MTTPATWTAEDVRAPVGRRRRLAALGGLAVAVVLAAVLFHVSGAPHAGAVLRDPGVFGRTTQVDLLPGYSVDADRRRLGPARVVLGSGQPLFIPARTPFSGAAPCRALAMPETDRDDACAFYVWFDEDGRSARWLTLLRPGGPDEWLYDGRLLAASRSRLVLADGTSIRPGEPFRLSECGDTALTALAGRDVVISIDDATGRAHQVTCRA